MPVVLYEVGGVARSGHLYEDRTGISYEYPRRRHSGYIETGDRFVYQRPGEYVGCGVIGEIRPSSDPARLVCDVLSVSMFDKPVSLKNALGEYFEADPTYWKGKIYWGQGVRPLSDARFDAIIDAAQMSGPASGPAFDPTTTSYADPKTAAKVEDYSVAVAVAEMRARFDVAVEIMPHSNPGFDLRVGSALQPVRFVEVKGTQAAEPIFFLSEGERKFSVRNARLYTLVVVTGINWRRGTHDAVVVRDGAIIGQGFSLQATQWRGQLT